jgi:hypothetical protein
MKFILKMKRTDFSRFHNSLFFIVLAFNLKRRAD